ncbi:MAG: SRPBCC family protein [Pseudomonadota bacterium]
MKHAVLTGFSALAVLLGAAPSPAQAEVIRASENGFITRDAVVVEAGIKATWLALIAPADWWSSQHTWSADASNLRLTPQAGGCFCEKIPEVDEPGRFTLEGSVEHMRVIQAYPETALRMVGALGPLQSEPVTGVLTIALTEVDIPGAPGMPARKGTRIVWEYNVGGSMRYEVPVISKAVDGVMSLQLAGLAQKLGPVDLAVDGAAETPEEAAEEAAGEGALVIEAQDTLKDGEPAGPKAPSVDEAFDDFLDEGVTSDTEAEAEDRGNG